jgi:hypothetical protein
MEDDLLTGKAKRIRNSTHVLVGDRFEADVRLILGDWKGAANKIGTMNRSSGGTPVDRTIRYVILIKLDKGTAPDIPEDFYR